MTPTLDEKRENRAREHALQGALRRCESCGKCWCRICTCACEREKTVDE